MNQLNQLNQQQVQRNQLQAQLAVRRSTKRQRQIRKAKDYLQNPSMKKLKGFGHG